MTASATTVERYTNYRLGTDFTQENIDEWLPKAEARFARENTGISADEADEAVTLLLAHRISLIKAKGGDKTSEDYGTYKYSRSPGLIGKSGWLADYYALLASASTTGKPRRGGVPLRDGPRYDTFRLSRNRYDPPVEID